MNTQSNIPLERLKRAKQNRYNPLSSIADPAQMTRKLDAFEVGYLKESVNIWDLLEQRDDLVRAVVSKRKKAVGRQGWTVLIHESLPADRRAEAQAHADALEHFYTNLRCENALDRSERGGFKLLCRQMMDAVGKRFAVHEIVWRNTSLLSASSVVQDSTSSFEPRTSDFLTATFRFVPLSFFENTTGTLRFLEHESALEGILLEPGAWMITTGEGLMMATTTAWMLKHIALNDWLLYAERNGRPIIRGTTAAAENSPEWKALEARLEDILNGNAVVHSSSDDVKVLDLAVGGNIPYPDLVDRIDRMIAALWRGADLSTMSRDRGYGASLQEKETCALEEDDAELLTETLNEYVDKWVIRYLFGDDAQPLANIKVLVTPKECTTSDLEIDQFLYKTGAPLALHDLMTRYGRALPKPGEPFLQLNPNLTPNPLGRSRGDETLDAIFPPRARALREKSDSRESSHHATAHVPNSEDAPGCDSPVNSRDRSIKSLSETLSETSSDSPVKESEHSEIASCSAPSTVENDNRIRVHSCPLVVSGLSNTFELIQSDWIQLSPYGDFPHVRGLQRVDREAAETMVKQFNSFRGRLGRLFGGAPFYVGHPDLPQTSELADRKAYGWVMQLEAREDGLYGFVKWSDAGLDLLQQAHYKYLSPFWEAKQIGAENGRPIFRPTVLVSVGLTNQPNIPVKPLANSETTPETLSQALSSHLSEPCSSRGDETLSDSPPATDNEQLTTDENQMRVDSCSFVVSGSVPSEVRRSIPLHNMHTRSITENLGSRRGERFLHNTLYKIRRAVKSKMRLGQSYHDAWRDVREEHHDWFTNES